MSSKVSIKDLYNILHDKNYFSFNDIIYVPIAENYKNNTGYKKVLLLYENLITSPDDVRVFEQNYRVLKREIATNRKCYSVYLLEIIQNTLNTCLTTHQEGVYVGIGLISVACLASLIVDNNKLVIGENKIKSDIIEILNIVYNTSGSANEHIYEKIFENTYEDILTQLKEKYKDDTIVHDIALDKMGVFYDTAVLFNLLYGTFKPLLFDYSLYKKDIIIKLGHKLMDSYISNLKETLIHCLENTYDSVYESVNKATTELITSGNLPTDINSFFNCLGNLSTSLRSENFEKMKHSLALTTRTHFYLVELTELEEYKDLITNDYDKYDFTSVNRRGYVPYELAEVDLNSIIDKFDCSGVHTDLIVNCNYTVNYQEIIYSDGLILQIILTSNTDVGMFFIFDFRTSKVSMDITFVSQSDYNDEVLPYDSALLFMLCYINYIDIVQSDKAVNDTLVSDEYILHCKSRGLHSTDTEDEMYKYVPIYIAPFKRKYSSTYTTPEEMKAEALKFGIKLDPHECLVKGFIRQQRFRKDTEIACTEAQPTTTNAIHITGFGERR